MRCFVCGAPIGVTQGDIKIPVPHGAHTRIEGEYAYICGDCMANAEKEKEEENGKLISAH